MKILTNPTFALPAYLALLALLAGPALAGDGHAHAPDGSHAPAVEAPTTAVTLWSDTMELFTEYPALAAGRADRFIIHLTVLDGFQPVRDGAVTLRFRGADGSLEIGADTLLREGIFTPQVLIPHAGAYTCELEYGGPAARSVFDLGRIEVHGSTDDFRAAEAGADDSIQFLKEQQWKVPFATASASVGEIRRSVWAIGEVQPAPDAYVEIVAPADGVVQADGVALPGARVERGDVVARITPPLDGSGWAASQLALAQAERDLERARRLREQDAISSRAFEEAQNAYHALEAGHRRLAGSGRDGVLDLTAPFSGQVIDWQVKPGRRLRAGDHLMAIADPRVVWLRVNVYESDFRGLGTPVGAYVHGGSGRDGWEIPTDGMKVLAVGGALDPTTRTIPVLLEVANADGRLTIHESTPVELHAGDGSTGTNVPLSAVYEDEGLDVVFVQTGGESFAKRPVRLGPRQGDRVSILEGVAPGERVVVRGGYHVKLASTSAAIGHGHAH